MCPICENHTLDHGLCSSCWKNTQIISRECIVCGYPYSSVCNEQLIQSHSNSNAVLSDKRICDYCPVEFVTQCDRNISIFTYQGIGKKIVQSLKQPANLPKFTRFIKNIIQSKYDVIDNENIDIVTHVPMYWSKFVRRGYNQSDALADITTEIINKNRRCEKQKNKNYFVNLMQSSNANEYFNRNKIINSTDKTQKPAKKQIKHLRLLRKIKNTQAQSKLTKSDRMQGVKNSFAIQNTAKIRGANILLIDDVMTTGATICECARVLKENGAKKVIILTLARTLLGPAGLEPATKSL
jgi:predicted amidophosphoribosyltransferase